jgi:signal transduction histidine kinase
VREGVALIHDKHLPCIIIEVEDTGAGIAPELQQRLFDPFFTTKETGTGLGLSIAACIIERHGGAIKFQTRPQRGTIFSILMPVAENEPCSKQLWLEQRC